MEKTCFILSLLFLVCTAFPALAQQQHGWPTLSLTGGGYSLGNSSGLDGESLYGLKLGYEINGEDFAKRLGVEAVYQRVDGELKSNDSEVDISLVRLDLLFLFDPLKKAKKIAPFLTVGAGGFFVDGETISSTDPLVAFGFGTKVLLNDSLSLRLDLRQNLVFDEETRSDYEYTAGLTYKFGVKSKARRSPEAVDSDGDGVLDIRDKCSDTPPQLKVDKQGCPVDAPDSDADGVADYQDKCPDTPEGLVVDPDGCFLDDDGDGVPNERDRCPANPPGFPVDEHGCTKIKSSDQN